MIKKYEKLSKSDETGVIKLYNALVSKECSRPINLKLMVTQGFPAFEETIGAKDFDRVKKYFGIGVKKPLKNIRVADLKNLIGKLRTIGNARFYLDGFEKMLEDIASKLDGAPDNWNTIIKAKFIRMYEVICCGFYYFFEDCITNPLKHNQNEMVIDYERAIKNNQKPFNPEELFYLYERRIKFYPQKNMIFESMIYTINGIDSRIFKEIMRFAELKFDSVNGFTDVNSTIPNQTFGSIRSIKKKVFKEPGLYPIEAFFLKDLILMQNVESLYSAYKMFKVIPLDKFDRIELPIVLLEGSRIVKKTHSCYKIASDFIISGEAEAGRFINLVDTICYKHFKLKFSETDQTECDMSLYMSTISFLLLEGYIGYDTIKEDLEKAKVLIDADKTNALVEYRDDKISAEEVKKRIGIDSKFERENFGVEREIKPEEVIAELVIKLGYVNKEQVDEDFLTQVLVSGNETKIKELVNEKELTRAQFEKIFGLDPEFTEMFFDLKKVDINAIERKLLDLKKKLAGEQVMKKQKSLIKLYCYLVENEVRCGPKSKVPKRNKGLKPANLKKFIE